MTAEAMGGIFDLPAVSKLIEMQEIIRTIPGCSKKNFYLAPWHFDFSEQSKFGAVGRFPSNHQYKAHVQSFLNNGLEAHRECIEVKFANAAATDGSGEGIRVSPFSVGFVDGQNKVLIIQSILALIHEFVAAFISECNHCQKNNV